LIAAQTDARSQQPISNRVEQEPADHFFWGLPLAFLGVDFLGLGGTLTSRFRASSNGTGFAPASDWFLRLSVMQILFADDSRPPPDAPKRDHKYFVLAGLAVPELNWHSLSRVLLNIKKRDDIKGEIKWRYFSPSNRDASNPIRDFPMGRRDRIRADIYKSLLTRSHICTLAVVVSIDDAYDLPYVKNGEDIYFYAYKILTERFQYRIQDVNRKYNINRHGIVVCDARDSAKDMTIRHLHDRLVTDNSRFSSDYKNLIEGLFIAPSHLSVGIQYADMIAGATYHYFSQGHRRWFDTIKPTFRCNDTGKIEGYGVSFFPQTWKRNLRRGVEA
jgi:hypothetical protein